MFDEDFFLDEKEYKPENYMISDDNHLTSDIKEYSQSREKSNKSKSNSHDYFNQIEPRFQDVLDSAQHIEYSNEREERSEFVRFFENLHIDSYVAKIYCHSLAEIGFDNLNSLQDVKETELLDVGVKLGHARQIKRAISTVQNEFSPYNILSSFDNNRIDHPNLEQNYTVYDKDVYHDASFDEDMIHHDTSFEENLKLYSEKKDVETSISPTFGFNMNNIDLNTSFDASTCPDDMEYARQKIKRMAARIQSLETQLTANSGNNSKKLSQERKSARNSTGSRNISPKKNILSKEERLQAHLERKSLENKHKETIMKFDKNPPTEKPNSITKIVKKNDDMVQRLTAANASERRHHDQIKRKLKKRLSLVKSQNTGSPTETSKSERKNIDRTKLGNRSHIHHEESEITKLNVSPSIEKKKISFTSKKLVTSPGSKKISKRDALMARLAMSAKDRRNLETVDIPTNVQRVIKGHKMKKSQWKMSENYISENEESHVSDEDEKRHNKQKINNDTRDGLERLELKTSRSQFSCSTCNSNENCEEDIDDPGTFYCHRCWNEYDVEHPLDSEFPPSPTHLMPQKKPDKLVSNKKKKRENEAIWLVHDNSLLGRKVSIGMKFLLETKDKVADTMRLVTGVIDYSGSVIKSGLDSTEEIEKCELGSECFRLRNALGYIVNRNNVETREAKSGEVIEIKLNESDGAILTTQGRSKSKTQSTLKQFLHGCDGAIDVILEPQHDASSWYPLWDNETKKKIAPHFRSKGVGYIRLGDDMSKNGAAFLSCDECQSFLSSVPNISSPLKNMKTIKKSSNKNTDDTKALANKTKDGAKSNTDRQVQSPLHEKENIDELLKKMQNDDIEKEMTWQEKAEIIKRLGKCISLQQDGEMHATAALTMLQNIICSKNVNIHVLRTSIISIAHIGQRIKHELVVHISWRAIMAELLKLLKNKQVSNDVRNTLTQLHSECFRLSNIIALISQALGFGKPTVNGNKIKLSRANSSSSAMGSSRRLSSGGGNNVLEILDWLSDVVLNECQILNCTIDTTSQLAVLDKCGVLTLLQFFVSHIGHRDAKCRKYVENGIVHSIVYGVEQSIIELESFLATDSTFGEIKALNVRMYKTILLRIKKLIDKESD